MGVGMFLAVALLLGCERDPDADSRTTGSSGGSSTVVATDSTVDFSVASGDTAVATTSVATASSTSTSPTGTGNAKFYGTYSGTIYDTTGGTTAGQGQAYTVTWMVGGDQSLKNACNYFYVPQNASSATWQLQTCCGNTYKMTVEVGDKSIGYTTVLVNRDASSQESLVFSDDFKSFTYTSRVTSGSYSSSYSGTVTRQ